MTEQDTQAAQPAFSIEEDLSPEVRDETLGTALIGILTQLAHRKRMIATVTVIGMLAGVVTSLLLPVRYTATTRIMSPRETPSAASLFINQMATSNVSSLAAIAQGGIGLRNSNGLYMGLMQSRPIIDELIRKFGLANLYHAKDMTAARKVLLDNTAIVSEKSGLIAVSVTDSDKKRAAEIANGYTDQLRALTQSLAISEASQRRLFYEEQLKSAKQELIDAEFAFQQVQQKKGLVQLNAQAATMISSLAALRAQVAAKEVQVQALRSFSTDRNPDVQLAESELSTLQEEVSRLEQKNHSSGFANLGLADVPAASLDYLTAEHELQYRQTLFDLLIKQYDAAKLDEAKEAAVIQVVESAIPPDRKTSPHRAVLTLIFTVLAFLGACLCAYLSARIRTNPATTQALSDFKSALFNAHLTH